MDVLAFQSKEKVYIDLNMGPKKVVLSDKNTYLWDVFKVN